MSMIVLNIEVFRRTGFRPCCDDHMDYKPCSCKKFAAACKVNNEVVMKIADSPVTALQELMRVIPLEEL